MCQLRRWKSQCFLKSILTKVQRSGFFYAKGRRGGRGVGRGCFCKTLVESRIPVSLVCLYTRLSRSCWLQGHGNKAGLKEMELERDRAFHPVMYLFNGTPLRQTFLPFFIRELFKHTHVVTMTSWTPQTLPPALKMATAWPILFHLYSY